MPSVEQVHSQDHIPGLDQRVVGGVVGRRPGKSLDIDEQVVGREAVGGEEFGAAPSSEGLGRVCVFDPLVVARVRVAPVVDEAGLVVQDVVLAEGARLVVGGNFGGDV